MSYYFAWGSFYYYLHKHMRVLYFSYYRILTSSDKNGKAFLFYSINGHPFHSDREVQFYELIHSQSPRILMKAKRLHYLLRFHHFAVKILNLPSDPKLH